jgi:hypothetical protein
MTSLLFVSLAMMTCWNTTDKNPLQRCVYKQEVIVRAEDLRSLNERKYLLGTISKKPSVGCFITLSTGETVMSGNPCRKVFGQ